MSSASHSARRTNVLSSLIISDKSLASLTKHVQQVFTPEDHDDSERRPEAVVSGSAIESAISSVAERVNYGIDWIEKITAPLSVWRWEVRNDRFDLLPKAARDKIESRLAERQQVSPFLSFETDWS